MKQRKKAGKCSIPNFKDRCLRMSFLFSIESPYHWMSTVYLQYNLHIFECPLSTFNTISVSLDVHCLPLIQSPYLWTSAVDLQYNLHIFECPLSTFNTISVSLDVHCLHLIQSPYLWMFTVYFQYNLHIFGCSLSTFNTISVSLDVHCLPLIQSPYLWTSAVDLLVIPHTQPTSNGIGCTVIESLKAQGGGGVAQSVERATPGEELTGSIPAVATRSLLVGSVSV